MKSETEEVLVASAKGGDERAFETLAENYKRVLEWHIKRLNPPSSLYDDLFQEGLIGLLKAVRSYDGKSSSFATFASLCVKHSIISAVRKYTKQACKTVSLPEDASGEETVPSAEEILLDGERVRILYDIVCNALSPFEKKVFDLYLSDAPYEEITASTGKSMKSIGNAVYRIRQKLKQIVGTADSVCAENRKIPKGVNKKQP